jgi:hypothetical protein
MLDINQKGVNQMKILEINKEWRIAVDTNGNYMPERYVIREGGKTVGGKETKAFEGWERQNTYHANNFQALKWIATKVNYEGGDQNVLDSLQDILSGIKSLMCEMESINGST